MGDIAQRGNRLTFAKGGKGEWIEPIKTKAKKDTESVRDVRAGGGAIRVGKAFGGPSHSVRRAVKKILKKAKAKKDTESVRDVRAGGGAIRATTRQIAKKIKAKKDTESVKDVR